MSITGRSKTSIWFHIKDIKLSDKKRLEIAKNSSKRAIAVAASRRGISKRSYKTFDIWTPDLVLLVGHLLFDGELSRSRCSYNNRNDTLIQRVQTLFRHVYVFEPTQYSNPKTGVRKISYNNVALTKYLRGKSDQLLVEIETLSLDHKREFIRAFFDDEGYMDYRPVRNVRQIRGYQNDKNILQIIKTLLLDFAIEAKIKEPNEVVVNGKKNLKKFQMEINFSKGVYPNPNRSNALRKEVVEKRDILDQAIKSFKS